MFVTGSRELQVEIALAQRAGETWCWFDLVIVSAKADLAKVD